MVCCLHMVFCWFSFFRISTRSSVVTAVSPHGQCCVSTWSSIVTAVSPLSRHGVTTLVTTSVLSHAAANSSPARMLARSPPCHHIVTALSPRTGPEQSDRRRLLAHAQREAGRGRLRSDLPRAQRDRHQDELLQLHAARGGWVRTIRGGGGLRGAASTSTVPSRSLTCNSSCHRGQSLTFPKQSARQLLASTRVNHHTRVCVGQVWLSPGHYCISGMC